MSATIKSRTAFAAADLLRRGFARKDADQSGSLAKTWLSLSFLF